MQRFRSRDMAFGDFLSDIARAGMEHQPNIVFGVQTDLYKVVQSVTGCALDFKRQSRISMLFRVLSNLVTASFIEFERMNLSSTSVHRFLFSTFFIVAGRCQFKTSF